VDGAEEGDRAGRAERRRRQRRQRRQLVAGFMVLVMAVAASVAVLGMRRVAPSGGGRPGAVTPTASSPAPPGR
jgi:hypothetical protein